MKEVRIHNGEVKYKNKLDLRIENTIYEKKIPSKVTGGLHGTEESLNLKIQKLCSLKIKGGEKDQRGWWEQRLRNRRDNIKRFKTCVIGYP